MLRRGHDECGPSTVLDMALQVALINRHTDMLMRLTNDAFDAYLDFIVEPIVIC